MKLKDVSTIAVIGHGNMGQGIAQTALVNGYQVHLCGHNQDSMKQGIAGIYRNLDKLYSKNKISQKLLEDCKSGCLRGFISLQDAVSGAEFVIEAVPEIFELKAAVLKEIDKYAPSYALIATNTSTMSITRLASFTDRRDKVMGMHYFYPVPVMELVEVIRGAETSEETIRFGIEYVKRIRKIPLLVQKDTPGFVANRIAGPVCVYHGLCIDSGEFEPEDIDLSLRHIGQKMGPMELADFAGIDVMNSVQRYYQKYLSPDYGPSETAKELEISGRLGKKSGRGYYIWPAKGKVVLDEKKLSGKYDLRNMFFIQANEACKLAEEGVCTLRDCDKAMEYGYHTQGPISYIQSCLPQEIAGVLDSLAKRYQKDIFWASAWIREGKYIYEEK